MTDSDPEEIATTITAEQATALRVQCTKPERTYCGAKTRNGGTCKLSPLEGRTRCKLHGGASPRGKDSPHFKHGLYQRALPKNLKANFEKLMSDPNLLEGRAEVSLMQLRLSQLSGRVECNESGKAWRELQAIFASFRQANDAGDQAAMIAELNRMNELVNGEVNDEAAWQELTDFAEKATRVAEREWKRVLATRQMLSGEQLRAVVLALGQAVNNHVKDPQARLAIAEDFRRLGFSQPATISAPEDTE